MKLLIHQAVKDVRLLWWLAAVWVLLVALFQVLTAWSAFLPPDGNAADPIARGLATATVLFEVLIVGVFAALAVGVVQDDPAVGTTAFWFTRPISLPLLVGAKLLVAAIVLVIVPIAADAVALVAAGLRPGDAVATVPTTLLVQLAWLLPVMAVAAVTLNVAQFVLGVLLEAIVCATAFFAVSALARWPNRVPPLYGPSPELAYTASALTFVILGFVVVAHAYRTRAARRAAALLAGAGVLAPVILLPWQPNIAWPHRVVVSPPGGVRIAATSLRLDASGESAFGLSGGFRFGDVPSADIVTVAGIRAWIDYPGARVEIPATRASYSKADPRDAGRQMRAVFQALAPDRVVGPYAPREGPAGFFAAIGKDVYAAHAYQSGVLQADVRLSIDRVRVAARVAPGVNQRYQASERAGRIVDVTSGSGGFDVTFGEVGIGWLFSRSVLDYGGVPRLCARNTRLGVVALPSMNSGPLPRPARQPAIPLPAHLGGHQFTYAFAAPEGVSPADWLRDAELVVLETGHVGDVIVHITEPDIVLSSLRHIGPAAPR